MDARQSIIGPCMSSVPPNTHVYTHMDIHTHTPHMNACTSVRKCTCARPRAHTLTRASNTCPVTAPYLRLSYCSPGTCGRESVSKFWRLWIKIAKLNQTPTAISRLSDIDCQTKHSLQGKKKKKNIMRTEKENTTEKYLWATWFVVFRVIVEDNVLKLMNKNVVMRPNIYQTGLLCYSITPLIMSIITTTTITATAHLRPYA